MATSSWVFLFHILPFQFRLHLVFVWFSFEHSKIFHPIKILVSKSTSRIWYGHVVSPTASSTYALSYLEFNLATFASSHLIGWNLHQWNGIILKNLPNPSFIKYFVLLKFSSRFSRTSSREFSLMYFFISFSIFESTLASLYSLPGLAKHGRFLIVVRKAYVHPSPNEDFKTHIAS